VECREALHSFLAAHLRVQTRRQPRWQQTCTGQEDGYISGEEAKHEPRGIKSPHCPRTRQPTSVPSLVCSQSCVLVLVSSACQVLCHNVPSSDCAALHPHHGALGRPTARAFCSLLPSLSPARIMKVRGPATCAPSGSSRRTCAHVLMLLPAVPPVDERGEGHEAAPHLHPAQRRDSHCPAEEGTSSCAYPTPDSRPRMMRAPCLKGAGVDSSVVECGEEIG
jgi:hypothetical protein